MRVCHRCGEDNPERARFCLTCGQSLADTSGAPERFRKTATMLFTDVVGSTALGSQVDAEVFSHVMTAFREAMQPVIEEHGGRLEKFIGDALVAAFGVPESHEDDALRACRAAVGMRERLQDVNAELERTRGISIAIRTGIATGPITGKGLPGDPGLVAGDTGNTAARLQGAAEPGDILLGEPTYRLVRAGVDAELLPPLELRGKAGPVTAYRLLAVLGDAEAVPRRLDAPLVGRERELEELAEEFRHVVEEGRCRLVTLVGEPGVGKSRLVRELAAQVGREATVVEGRCLPYGEGITYWPVAEIVRRAARIDTDDTATQALEKVQVLLGDDLLAQHIAALVGLTDRQPPPGEVPAAVRALVETLAVGRPLFAVVDDIHWAEPTLLELLEYLGSRAAAPVLLLCVARPELLEGRADWPNVVHLKPLSSDESAQLVRTLLHEAGVAASAVKRITDAAGGNPLFCEQMVSMLIDDGRLAQEGRRWVARDDLSSLGVPPTLHALMAARLEGVARAERTAITRAAVVGQEFSRNAVRELLPAELAPQVDSLLATLVRRDFVTSAGDGGGQFAFRHLVIRDVAYETLTKADRADLHERVGAWVDRTAGSRASEYDEIIGYHLEQAHRYRVELYPVDDRARRLAARASELLAAAGRRAHRRGDLSATTGLLTRALDLMALDDPRRPAVLIDVGDALLLAVRHDEVEAAFSEAADAAATAGDERLELVARLSLLTHRVVHAREAVDLAAAREQGRSALRRFEQAGDDLGISRACRLLSHLHRVRSQVGEAAALLERGINPARRADDVFLRYDVGNLVAALAEGSAPTSLALTRGLELLESVRSDRMTAAGIASNLALVYALRGEFEHGRALVEPAILAYEELGHVYDALVFRVRLLVVEALAEDWPACESLSRQLHEGATAIGFRAGIAGAALMIGESLSRQARWDEAAQFAATAAEEAAALPDDPQMRSELCRLQARLCAHTGAHEDAERLARDGLEAALEVDSLWRQADALMDLAEVLELAGRTDEARGAIEQALQAYEQKEHLVGMERARAALASRVVG